MRLASRRARLSVGAGLAVLFAASLAGCSFISNSNRTLSALRSAGYRNVGIHIESGSGLPADGLVDISYSSGPSGNAEGDADHAARIVWNTLPYRMGALVITRTSGGCAGGFCVSHSTDLGSESYAQMRAQFGPRSVNLDQTAASQAVRIPLWVPLVVGAVVLVAATAIVIAIVRSRHRPRGGPWIPPNSGGSWAPQGPPWGPATQPAPPNPGGPP